MKKTNRITTRLIQVLLIQAMIISATALLGVWAARYVIGDILIQRALEDEAGHFWELYDENPAIALPDTHNLKGYMEDSENLPVLFKSLDNGFHKIQSANTDVIIIHVSQHKQQRLYLKFDGEQVSKLALFFGIFPLAIFLMVIYLSGWIAYKLLSREVSPVVRLARTLESLDPSSEDFAQKLKLNLPRSQTQEVAVLANALEHLSERIEDFVNRERNFTRDASHELRSPITVIKLACEVLLQDNNITRQQSRTIVKIKNSASDMEELIETLLVLARESDKQLSYNEVCLNDVCKEEMERAALLLKGKPITTRFESRNELWVVASDKVLSVMIGNLLRNAYSYTDKGSVVIKIEGSELIIEDSGVGMPDDELQNVFKPFQRGKNRKRGGYGVGLTIVKMLSDRFKWPISINSEINKGTQILINFPTGALR